MGILSKPDSKLSGLMSWATLLLFFLLCGALLLFFPTKAIAITSVLIGILLCLNGIKNGIHYFMVPAVETLKSIELGTGLIEIFFGILFLITPNSFSYLLGYVWSISILMGAFSKIQLGVTALRMKKDLWWLYFILAAISCIMGFLAFFGVMGTKVQLSVNAPIVALGVFLWIEAVLDIFCLIYNTQQMKKKESPKAEETAPATAAE